MIVHTRLFLTGRQLAGRLITTTLPNDIVTVNVYDDADRLTQLSHTVSGTGKLIGQYEYLLDGVGNRLAVTETIRTPGGVFSSPLTLGSVLTVTAVSEYQEGVALAYNANEDEYLAVWRDSRNDAGDIYGHFRDSDGAAIGSAFTVHITTTDQQSDPAITYSADGDRYLVVWADRRSGVEIYGRLFDGEGTAQGAEFLIGDGVAPEVAYDAESGQFMVVYKYEYLLKARSVSITGTMGTAFTAANDTLLEQPEIAADGAGTFLTVWQYSNGGDWDILGQRINLTTTVGSVITVTNATGRQERPALAYDAESEQYLVIWKDGRNIQTIGDKRQLWGQFVDLDGSLNGSNFRIDDTTADDIYNPATVVLAGRWLAAWRHTTDVYYRPVDDQGNLDDTVTLASATETQAAPAFAGHESAALAGWQTNEIYSTGYDISNRPISAPITGTLRTTVIAYTYDDLYRLTDAGYTGAISATYAYEYDAVGNMTYYTETIGTETTRVTRYFNDWNQLIAEADHDLGTTSHYYDDAGNLVETLPPGVSAGEGLQYGYDQRNLLITATTYVSGTGQTAVADYVYDGNGDRLQQVDYTGASVITTTYTNDPMGLTQVLVADDGTGQVYNVRGYGLIAQYGGVDDLFLLTDGLGSVRQELTGTMVLAVTTYGPYGNVVEAAGSRVSVYGFTGEQEDGATGLLYLRARYYDSSLRTFVSRDPYSGQPRVPATMHGYSYAHSNPVMYSDPSGLKVVCHQANSILSAGRGGGSYIPVDRTDACMDWVFTAAQRLYQFGGPDGQRVANEFYEWLDGERFLHIVVSDGELSPRAGKMATREWAPSFLAYIYIHPDVLNQLSNDGLIALFGHELEHLHQGPLQAASIQGEILAYQTEYRIRDEMGAAQTPNTRMANNDNPYLYKDLLDARNGYLNDGYNVLHEPNLPWTQDLPHFLYVGNVGLDWLHNSNFGRYTDMWLGGAVNSLGMTFGIIGMTAEVCWNEAGVTTSMIATQGPETASLISNELVELWENFSLFFR